MRGKEEVINDVLHYDYNSQIKTWLKMRLNGVWNNGYCHGKEDALKEFLETPKPLTNYDRLHAMGPEELAEFMCHAVSPSGVINCSSCEAQGFCRMGHNGWLDWLKQPIEEDE